MPSQSDEELKTELKKQLIIGLCSVLVVALAVWVEYAAAEEMGTHEQRGRLQSWWDGLKRRREFEETVKRDLNKVMFEAALILGAV
jgi:hypothetical protein